MADGDEPIGLEHVVAGLEDLIKTADPAKREQVARLLDAYRIDYPEEVEWALGAQSPKLLYFLFLTIIGACQPDYPDRPKLKLVREANAT